jgi:hypothetical protein
MNYLANLIALLHFLLIVFITVTPFVADNPLILLYYSFTLVFIMIHWYTNDICVLTIIESKLRGKKIRETFMGRLIRPVYNITSKEVHMLAFGLLFFALLKTRLWEKERFDRLKTLLYIHWRILKLGFINLFSKESLTSADSSQHQPTRQFGSSNIAQYLDLVFGSPAEPLASASAPVDQQAPQQDLENHQSASKDQ